MQEKIENLVMRVLPPLPICVNRCPVPCAFARGRLPLRPPHLLRLSVAVGKAFGTLSDPQKRAQYDRFGEEGVQEGMRQRSHGGAHGAEMYPEDIYDIFAQMFGGMLLPTACPQRIGTHRRQLPRGQEGGGGRGRTCLPLPCPGGGVIAQARPRPGFSCKTYFGASLRPPTVRPGASAVSRTGVPHRNRPLRCPLRPLSLVPCTPAHSLRSRRP